MVRCAMQMLDSFAYLANQLGNNKKHWQRGEKSQSIKSSQCLWKKDDIEFAIKVAHIQPLLKIRSGRGTRRGMEAREKGRRLTITRENVWVRKLEETGAPVLFGVAKQ